jgi:hypothetical protein
VVLFHDHVLSIAKMLQHFLVRFAPLSVRVVTGKIAAGSYDLAVPFVGYRQGV